MSIEADVFTSAPGRREKPWLLASNHKLRHLQGISLRNLTIKPNPIRSRGKTIDDDNIPYTLKSPAKLLAQQDTRGLHHSRSSTDLSLSPKATSSPSNVGAVNTSEKLPLRPHAANLRRRSTLQWSGASPLTRQRRLEDVAAGRMVDTWFSLHVQGLEEPVYISEVIEKAMNPSFRFFDLNACGPLVTRLDELTIKFWAKTEISKEWTLLVELQLNLRSLQFIGKTLENFRHPLPPNCLIFHLTDGIYTNFTDLAPDEPVPFDLSRSQGPIQDGAQFTSSYDALMRLANLDDCIQDALATREELESQINSILAANSSSISVLNTNSLVQERLSSTKRAVAHEKRQLRATIKKREDLKSSLQARRQAMSQGLELQSLTQSHLSEAQSNLNTRHTLLEETKDSSRGQIRRICEDLQSIYPIDPIPGKHYSFTIRRLPLPNSSSLSNTDPETTAAALGHVAHLVYLLSFYLSTSLPFPIKPFSSRSFIQDPIASTIPPTQRIYPLYPGVQFRFEYGVFLLNKDIEVLLSQHSLRISDLRHTLPNLKYLLFVLTSGTGELPARKAGGVRGLLTGRLNAGPLSPSLSRRGSEDSAISDVSSGDGMLTRKGTIIDDVTGRAGGQITGNGGMRPPFPMSKGKEKEKPDEDITTTAGKKSQIVSTSASASASAPSSSAATRTTLPFRGSGLREIVQ